MNDPKPNTPRRWEWFWLSPRSSVETPLPADSRFAERARMVVEMSKGYVLPADPSLTEEDKPV